MKTIHGQGFHRVLEIWKRLGKMGEVFLGLEKTSLSNRVWKSLGISKITLQCCFNS